MTEQITTILNLGKRSCMFILQNKELSDRIINETPIRLNEAARKYNISRNIIKGYIDSNLVSSFCNVNTKGSPIFIFENG
jgi:hypothetical protein